ncbi:MULTISPECIES: anthrone oxygenase family protein [unclassified Microbacterium]|uniref:anthrone oxygenase family protein n=1 Tax=unclassified Microbacterium TaxID=2609290 RepID=UPI00301A26ED
MTVLLTVQLVLAGLLAGEELIVRWGIQPAISSLPDDAHVRTRIALVRRLKVVVPILMVPTLLASVALVIAAGGADGFAWRIAGMAAMVVFALSSFLGTVPINMGVNDWDPAAPPANWRHVVTRWERIDVLRSSAAAAGFILFTVALVAQLG